MRISIFSALLISFLALIWGTYLVNSSSSYVSSQTVMQQHARTIMGNVANYVMEQNRNYLGRAQELAELSEGLLQAHAIDTKNRAVLENYFLKQLKAYPDIAGIYLATPDGGFNYVSQSGEGYRSKFITAIPQRRVALRWCDQQGREIRRAEAPDDSYDPRSRPWYRGAVTTGTAFWTKPYIFYTSQTPGITIALPSYGEDGSLRAVVGVDIEIAQLSYFIANLKIGKSGRAVMVSRDRDVVAFHDVSKIRYNEMSAQSSSRLAKISEFDDALFSAAFRELLPVAGAIDTTSELYTLFKSGSKQYQAMLMPFADQQWPWLIAMYYPEDDYLGGLKRNRAANNWLMLGISIVATLLALLLARSIARPIVELRTFATAIDEGCHKKVELATRFRETAETAKVFADLHEQLVYETQQRKSVEEDLVVKESQYDSLVEDINVAVFRADVYGNIINANAKCLEMLRVEDLEQAEKVSMWALFSEAEDRGRMIEMLHKRETVENFEFKYSRDIERCGWASLFARMRYADGVKSLYVDGIIYDITEQREAQESLIAAERLAAVGTLAGGVAHEFNNIHAGILGYAELALIEEGLSERVHKYLDSIRLFSLRTKSLTTNLLSFASKKTTGKKPSSLNALVRETLELVEGEFATEAVDLRVSYGSSELLMVDASQISQVILNLLINARHALLGCEKREIEVVTGSEGAESWVRISDSGCGISEANRRKIFTPFFSTKGVHAAGESPQTSVVGTGLGLSVCDTIIKNHQGRIEVESEEGSGARFTVFLPNGLDVEAVVEVSAPSTHSDTGRVMVIDDEEHIRTVAKKALADVGYAVIAGDDGAKMLKELEGGGFELLIVDLQMPKMGGRDCIERVQALPKEVRPAVVVITGRLSDEIQSLLGDLEVLDVITKPFERTEFQTRIAAVIKKIRTCTA